MPPSATFDTSRAREMHAAGLSARAIAKELGVAASTISRWAKQAGLEFDRGQTAQASAARSVDAKARRQDVADRLYARALRNLDRLDAAEFRTLVREFGGAEAASTLDFVPPQAERDLTQAISTSLAAAARLEAIDSDGGAEEARSVLVEFGRALGIIPKE